MPEPIKAANVPAPVKQPRVVDSKLLFQGRRALVIEHRGAQYLMRITRKNKLILHK